MSRMVALDDLLDAHGVAEVLGLSHYNTVRSTSTATRRCLGRYSTSARAESSYGSAPKSRSGKPANRPRAAHAVAGKLTTEWLPGVFVLRGDHLMAAAGGEFNLVRTSPLRLPSKDAPS